MELSRRDWMLGSMSLSAWVAEAQNHAHEVMQSTAPPKLQIFDAALGAEVGALTAQIIPSDDGPGAREAGVVYFIDRALATFEADKQADYRKGMEEVQRTRRNLFPVSASIASLTAGQQIELLRAIEKSEFFELLRKHTVWGFVGSPIYGGNREKVGWRHIGLDDRMSFEPPFGYYDAEARKGEKP